MQVTQGLDCQKLEKTSIKVSWATFLINIEDYKILLTLKPELSRFSTPSKLFFSIDFSLTLGLFISWNPAIPSSFLSSPMLKYTKNDLKHILRTILRVRDNTPTLTYVGLQKKPLKSRVLDI